MNIDIAYKNEKISVSSVFKGYQRVHKSVLDEYDPEFLWVHASRVSSGVRNNAILKYSKKDRNIKRIIDFGENDIYSVHVSESYVSFLSSPSTPGNKRYLSFINKTGDASQPITSLYFESNYTPSEEYGNIYEGNKMYFDGRNYWVVSRKRTAPIVKVDIVNIGASMGLQGVNAPGGACNRANTEVLENWYPYGSGSLDGNFYEFMNELYFFPIGAGIFKINPLTNSISSISNTTYEMESSRISRSVHQIIEESEFSTSGEIILFSMRQTSSGTSLLTDIGIMDLSSMEFTVFPLTEDYSALKNIPLKVTKTEGSKIFFPVPAGEKRGLYFDFNESQTSEYRILGTDPTLFAGIKYPFCELSEDQILFVEADKDYLFLGQKSIPSRVIVSHLLEDGSLYGKEEIFYGEIGSSYEILGKAIEGKEVTSIEGPSKGTFQKEDVLLKFHYAPRKTKSFVRVMFKDREDNLLHSYNLEGFIGDTYRAERNDIPGYVLEESPANATGTFIQSNTDIVFIYRKLTIAEIYEGSSYVSVSYQDESGAEIKPSLYAVYPIGSNYTIPSVAIPGYDLLSSETATGICYNNTEYVSFVYRRKANTGLARIRYIVGTTTMDTDYVTGAIGGNVTYTPKTIEGFQFATESFSVLLSEEVSEYSIDCSPTMGLLLVHHIDVYDGKDIFPKEYNFAPYDETFNLRSKIVKNYSTQGNILSKARYDQENEYWSLYVGETLQRTEEGKVAEVTLYYDTVQSSVKVLYKKGDTILKEEIIEGMNGSPYVTLPEEYEPYQLDSIEGEGSGLFESREKTVTYLYIDRVCRVFVEHRDVLTKNLIHSTLYQENYGTVLSVPIETFDKYYFISSSSGESPDNTSVLFQKEDQTIIFQYLRIDSSTMLSPILSLDLGYPGVKVKTEGIKSPVENVRYKVEKRMNGGSWDKALPKHFNEERVLNIIESSQENINFTDHTGQVQTIPDKAVLKKWLEEENNGIGVDYIDEKEFNLSPEFYIKNEEGKFKYSIIVNGTYSTGEACLLGEQSQRFIEEWKNLGMGYIECNKKYKMSGRGLAIETEKELLKSIITSMKATTGLPEFSTIITDNTPLNESPYVENIEYEKIGNRLIIKFNTEPNGESNPNAVYDFRLTLINCADGSTHLSSVNSVASINTTLPVSIYRFLIDEESSTDPSEGLSTSDVVNYVRKETLPFIDKYIHVVGEDPFGRQTMAFHHRYYKEISIEDLNNINSVITYSPRAVKENHRYRGPIESLKINNFRSTVSDLMQELHGIFAKQEMESASIRKISNLDSYNTYLKIKDGSEM